MRAHVIGPLGDMPQPYTTVTRVRDELLQKGLHVREDVRVGVLGDAERGARVLDENVGDAALYRREKRLEAPGEKLARHQVAAAGLVGEGDSGLLPDYCRHFGYGPEGVGEWSRCSARTRRM